MLYSVYQRYNFESNLQHGTSPVSLSYCCIRYIKDTILKAIYNDRLFLGCCLVLYSVYQRYNFESNLQRIYKLSCCAICCIRYIKDTILKAIYNNKLADIANQYAVFGISKIQFWKQFTTSPTILTKQKRLYSVYQRYNFESNLQHSY